MDDGDEPLQSHSHCGPDGPVQRYLECGENPGNNIRIDLFLPLPPGKRQGEGQGHAEDEHGVKHGHHDQDLPECHLER